MLLLIFYGLLICLKYITFTICLMNNNVGPVV